MPRLTWIFSPSRAGLLTRMDRVCRRGGFALDQHQDAAVHGDVGADEPHDVVEQLVQRPVQEEGLADLAHDRDHLVLRPVSSTALPGRRPDRRRADGRASRSCTGTTVLTFGGQRARRSSRRPPRGPVEHDADPAQPDLVPGLQVDGPSILRPLRKVPFLLPASSTTYAAPRRGRSRHAGRSRTDRPGARRCRPGRPSVFGAASSTESRRPAWDRCRAVAMAAGPYYNSAARVPSLISSPRSSSRSKVFMMRRAARAFSSTGSPEAAGRHPCSSGAAGARGARWNDPPPSSRPRE